MITVVTSLRVRLPSRMKPNMSTRSKIWALVLVFLVLAQAAASLILRRPSFGLASFSDFIQCALLLCATYSCVPHILNSSNRVRAFWALMGLGLAAWLAYQSLWTYFEAFRGKEVPGIFAGDVILFLHFVPMMAALALQPNVRQDDREFRLGSLDFALLLLWWVYVYIYSVMPWQYSYPDEVAYGHNLNTVYLVEKIAFLLALGLLWWRSSDRWKKIYQHWLLASILYSSSSYVANWALARGKYYSGSLYDLPLVLSMAWMAVPGLLALQLPKGQDSPARHAYRGIWTARFGMVAVFSLPIFAWLAFSYHTVPRPVRHFRVLITLVSMLVMGALAFLKQNLLDIELLQSLDSSRKAFNDLRTVQEQLVQSEKLASLGQLVGGAAHELNNPLTAIIGYSELLTATELTSTQRSLAEKIALQSKRIRTLLASLLSFAKQAPAAKTDLDINVVVQTALKLCHPQVQAAGIQTSMALGDSLPKVHGDSNQLLQVFSHIINNAAHAMMERKDGKLAIATSLDDHSVLIEFADNGRGIEDPGKVFDPFYTTRPVGQGSGLGLSMCYGIIQGHGGKIGCHNRDLGGASFVIELPAASAAKAAGAGPRT